MFKKVMWIGLVLSMFGFVSAATVQADEWTKKMVLAFSQPVEIAPDVQEVPLTAAALQTTPLAPAATAAPSDAPTTAGTPVLTVTAPNDGRDRRLPETASPLPMILVLGFCAIGTALGVMVFNKYVRAPAV
jgi:hypothetical protein